MSENEDKAVKIDISGDEEAGADGEAVVVNEDEVEILDFVDDDGDEDAGDAEVSRLAEVENLRAELAEDGVHVVVACPSFFQTNLLATSRSASGANNSRKSAVPSSSVSMPSSSASAADFRSANGESPS